MRYTTHATGGVVAFAAATTALGVVDQVTLPALVVAGVSGLVADLDNHHGTVLRHRTWGKVIAFFLGPLAWGTVHRGRTHSLVGIGLFAGILLLYATLMTLALPEMLFPIIYLLAAVTGYASHLVLDALNREPVPLLWPQPFALNIPPGYHLRHLRMPASSPLQHGLTAVGVMSLGVMLFPFAPDIATATLNDPALHGFLDGMGRTLRELGQ